MQAAKAHLNVKPAGEMDMSWDYSSSSDLEALAESIDTLETQGRAQAVVMLNESGLMRLPRYLQEIMSLFEGILPNREAVTNAVVRGLVLTTLVAQASSFRLG